MIRVPFRVLPALPRLALPIAVAILFIGALAILAADTVPTDVQIPGTQPTDNVPTINSVGNCGCHNFSGNLDYDATPVPGWTGGMMANAGRDPLFWSTVAIAEQDFLPGSGGVGDLCLHCHSVKGWLEGRSTPTNGSGLDPGTDGEGIMCEFCHLMTDPDQPNSIPSPPEGSYHEEQNGDFVAYDAGTGDGYYGGAEYVLNSGGTRLGPYDDHGAKHDAIPSSFVRDGRFCGTCHDVSNPAVGDLAPNHGSINPFTGVYDGTPLAPVAGKAAFNNPPAAYGIVERTFDEWVASDLDTWQVNNFAGLAARDPVLTTAGGSLEVAYQRSRWGTCSTSGDLCNVDANCSGGETCNLITADYQDNFAVPAAGGDIRYYTCQTCHMAASGGDGAQQGRSDHGDPWDGQIRADLPRHDQTGMSYWIQDVVQYQDTEGTLLFGSGLTADENTAMDAAQTRSANHLQSAAHLGAAQIDNDVQVKVTNLTGHKLISGYPEGRRMWLNLKWYQGPTLIHEDGAYGPLGVVVNDLDGDPWDVQSILDFSSTKIYEAKPAMTQDWAAALISLGYDPNMVIEWNRMTNTPLHTLGELAGEGAGAMQHTFHFVLNNAMELDNRIPPLGMSYDEALDRNAIPIPATQYGDPGPGGKFDHFDQVDFPVPAGADSVQVRLVYQATSWEYVQFLWLQNHGSDDPTPPLGDSFLGQEGVRFLDAWLNTGMAAPIEMTSVTIPVTSPAFHPPGNASGQLQTQMTVTAYDSVSGVITLGYAPACDATGHTIHYGNLADVGTYLWQESDCTLDASGTAVFTPDPLVGDSLFWVIVGTNPSFEGSYGTDSNGIERPAFTAAGSCFLPQSLATVCE